MELKKLHKSQIEYMSGTQIRVKYSPETVSHYTELIKDGVKFPPLDVVYDGKTYHLADGFQRLFSNLDAGIEEIECRVIKGTLKDAIVLACGANRKHGLPLDRGARKQAIVTLLEIPAWAAKYDKEIASHVGTSEKYVSEVRKKLEKEKTEKESRRTPVDTNAPSCPTDNQEYEDDDDIPEFFDKPAPKPEPENEPKAEEVPTDNAGKPLPEALWPVWKRAKKIRELKHKATDLKDEILSAQKTDPTTFTWLSQSEVERDFRNLQHHLQCGLPQYVCPYCGYKNRETCRLCDGHGFINNDLWRACAKELREAD